MPGPALFGELPAVGWRGLWPALEGIAEDIGRQHPAAPLPSAALVGQRLDDAASAARAARSAAPVAEESLDDEAGCVQLLD